ncbi:antibiotic biosynthesis monooxygenase [Micromonospora sp. WMMD1082]|uniref:antibiotic biosynthesis monooxygenase n=1 Tax=Micromonospora sp. WMMD1082 TaxID=3016104 RepID=UPI002416DD17|nr:antibiotic biosynthesis monooxygenase [Micromonospora sp. WMMD1082]MDG4795655.1 antibiotic biosynthesis monooxygenase [Micromonospora sp. WMMD1082]
MPDDAGFYSIIDYTVDGPQSQHELIEAFAEIQERRVRHYPGYRSARLLASQDGTRVYNVVAWQSEAHWRHFDKTDDLQERQADIDRAVDGISGTATPRMTNTPRYDLVREVLPPKAG